MRLPTLRDALKETAVLVDRFRPPTVGITILIYHRVGGGTQSVVDVDVHDFDRQIEWLREHRRVLSLDAAITELSGGSDVSPGVVITFDDGTVDWVDTALPILDRHDAPATFYVATDFVETGTPFPAGPAISWSGLAEVAAHPRMTIGSHTHTHRLLDRVGGVTAEEELDRSLELLEDRLGLTARHFAYPKALIGSPDAERAVRQRFRSATIAGCRSNAAGADRYRLGRTPVQTTDGWRFFVAKADGGLWFEDAIREVLNKARYRSTAN